MTRDDSRSSLADKVAFLRRRESFPEPTTAVEAIETHMSWVFLTDDFAYKLKKPVRFKLLNLATLEDPAAHPAIRRSTVSRASCSRSGTVASSSASRLVASARRP